MAVFQRGDFLLPHKQWMGKWPVIACDQFTAQPEYWKQTAKLVGQAPSTYHMIFPEAELGEDEEARIERIDRTMTRYLAEDVFRLYPQCYIYVERTLKDGTIRKGVVGLLDLESYDFGDLAKTPVRATEKTVVSRIPPRVKIRSGAAVECSHVLLLCSDPADRLLGDVKRGEKLYDLDLIMGGGHITGWLVSGENADRFDSAIAAYISAKEDGFCFAVGDGNHSLAAAKTCWETIKKQEDADVLARHPARYAAVELVNLFDPALQFEPIHRIVRNVDTEALIAFLEKSSVPGGRAVRWIAGNKSGSLSYGPSVLPVGGLQKELDAFLAENGGEIDYIHGEQVALKLSSEDRAAAFLLPEIDKNDLFRSISQSGVLPRKTFSIGHAEEKRYYLECRKIIP
ncbi:MAG: DUF1015 domain-containing protein [Oscillospiraceae bacterium]|nr:DUF1015 domain-containing protein [Oscillospiraceae bacterium]